MSGAAVMARSRDLDEGEEEIWGTWEELLLACAVARHGTRRWDSIASEVQSRIAPSSAPLFTPSRCLQRFDLLQLRFSAAVAADSGGGDESPGEVPLIEELRKLRVAELRREVERSDHSIVSLKLKLKNLKEEGERRLSGGSDPETDQNPKPESPGSTEEELARDRVSRESSKESNSTDPKRNAGKLDEEAGECTAGVGKRETEPATEEGDHGLAESRESGESAAELKPSDAEETSEGRTSASHARQPRRRRQRAPLASSSGGGEPEADVVSLRGGRTSQPLVKILEMIRGSVSGSVFESRLESQNTAEYRGLIRCHVDLEMISEKIERLETAAYTRTEFFRDLLLLCNNAIVFYPLSSKESIAAVHLRDQISKEMTATPQPSPQPQAPPPAVKVKSDPHIASLLEKSESAIPLIACRKRSSITSKKTNPDPKVKRKPDPDPDPDSDPGPKPKLKKKKKTKERPEPSPPPPPPPPPPPAPSRGFRTSKSRFLNQSRRSHPSTNPKAEEVEIVAKPEKKNSGGAASAALAKKRGAATLLKRIKRTPEENENVSPPSSTVSGDKVAGKKKARKGDGRRAPEPKGSNQKTGKKVVKVSAPAKRGREGVESAKPSPAAKKRRRR